MILLVDCNRGSFAILVNRLQMMEFGDAINAMKGTGDSATNVLTGGNAVRIRYSRSAALDPAVKFKINPGATTKRKYSRF
jgi:hypothetical protein